jgi:predicted enzyme related to lactoylglutathione lyase
MHKSKLAGFIIDCETADLTGAAAFWAAALGMQAQPPEGAYVALKDLQHGLSIAAQQVQHPSRVHLDIETDDVEAEVARLEKLGASRVKSVKTWWVMQAPTGHRFCVVQVQSADFDALATVWP